MIFLFWEHDRHAVDEALQVAELRRRDDLRVGFAGNFLDRREKLAGVLERLDELFLDDGGRAAADVHGMEVIAEGLDVVHFLAKIHEVRARHMLLEEEAVEGAVRAQGVAERNVCVQQVLVSVLWRWRILENDGVAVQVALRVYVFTF